MHSAVDGADVTDGLEPVETLDDDDADVVVAAVPAVVGALDDIELCKRKCINNLNYYDEFLLLRIIESSKEFNVFLIA